MDKELKNRIELISGAIHDWLHPKNYILKEAIDRTVNEGLFSFPDIKHQILTLKKTTRRPELLEWAKNAGLIELKQSKKILCLHAGNLPLVGLQDVLSVLISGAQYSGKTSRKDPYLLPTLLSIFEKKGLVKSGSWSTDLKSLPSKLHDGVLFSGSGESVEKVFPRLISYGLVENGTPALVRTAHFSIAYIEDDAPETMRNLAEAAFRYGGMGCRSVAIVVAPFDLHSKKCHFTDYFEEFLLKNPQHLKAPPSLYNRYAYNKAIGIKQAWLDNFLIEETELKPEEPFILHWVKGDKKTVSQLEEKYREGLQTVYVSDPRCKINRVETELLAEAQSPPIYWKPDGFDSLNWLANL